MIHNLIFGPSESVPDYDFERYHRRMVESIKAIYREGIVKAEVKAYDPEEVAVLVLSLIHFCFHLNQISPETPDPDTPERLLHIAFEGLAPKGNDK